MSMETAPEVTDGMLREHATLVSIVYHDPNGPWAICLFRRDDDSVFTATGSFGNSILYEDFILYGAWSPNIPGGDFDITSFTSMPPRALATLPRYLNSLTRVSISSTTKAVQFFGEGVIDILDKLPGRLVEAGLTEQEASTMGRVWAEERSEKLSLAQIDLEGIPPQKLSTLQRRLGNYTADLNVVVRDDPYLLYVHFDDMTFKTAQSLAKRFRVTNDTVSAIKGAVIAILRREAWLGHSYINGAPLMEAVAKLLNLTMSKEEFKPLIRQAVNELARSKVAHAEEQRLQLYNLYEIEKSLVEKAVQWTKLNADDLEDLVPSSEMAIKLLKPLKLGVPATRDLAAGLSNLLAERLALVQCETLHDQLMILQGIQLILEGFGTDVIFSAYSREMTAEMTRLLGPDAPITGYAELIGLDPETGVPTQRQQSPVETDVIVFLGADTLGVEETNFLLDAIPANGRLFLLGAPKDLPSQNIGQPFDELAKVAEIRTFLASFWLPARTDFRLAANTIWSGALKPRDSFDPSKPISWIRAPREALPEAITLLIEQFAETWGFDPLNDIKPVVVHGTADVPGKDVVTWLTTAIANKFVGEATPIVFHDKAIFKGMPAVIRQPLSIEHPAFSIFTATELTSQRMLATPRTGTPVELDLKRNLNVFHGGVLTPKFIRGRVYEIVILVVLKEHMKLINAELLSTLLNSSKQTLLLLGEIDCIEADFPANEPTRVRSLLPKWMAQNGDQICPA